MKQAMSLSWNNFVKHIQRPNFVYISIIQWVKVNVKIVDIDTDVSTLLIFKHGFIHFWQKTGPFGG